MLSMLLITNLWSSRSTRWQVYLGEMCPAVRSITVIALNPEATFLNSCSKSLFIRHADSFSALSFGIFLIILIYTPPG